MLASLIPSLTILINQFIHSLPKKGNLTFPSLKSHRCDTTKSAVHRKKVVVTGGLCLAAAPIEGLARNLRNLFGGRACLYGNESRGTVTLDRNGIGICSHETENN